MEDECIHLLDPITCSICVHKNDPKPQPGPVFMAKFPGTCKACRESIDLDDWIYMCDGQAYHEECNHG